ncbi:MAG: hypothetical protein NT154_45400, partial [Verrucomicrobia bacterium]|nr:hypothetical protein [Verrucomicrobiota bacterium]
MLQNSSLAITAGSGLSGGGTPALGGSTTLAADLNHDATLTGSGGASALGLNLGTPNTWAGRQTFQGGTAGDGSGLTNLTLAAGAVVTTNLADQSVTAAKLAPGVAGTVAQVNTGAGLTGGPITTSGTISVPSGGIANSMLANPALTVSAGAGLNGGGSVALGGSTTLSIGNGAIANGMLQNSSLAITAGSGLSGGGTPALGGSTTLAADLNHDATLTGS